MFKVSPASLQPCIDTPKSVLEDRVQYSTVHIPNVFCLKYCIFSCFLYCNRQVHKDILITLYMCKDMKGVECVQSVVGRYNTLQIFNKQYSVGKRVRNIGFRITVFKLPSDYRSCISKLRKRACEVVLGAVRAVFMQCCIFVVRLRCVDGVVCLFNTVQTLANTAHQFYRSEWIF